MKNTFLVSATTLLLMSCGGGSSNPSKEKEMSDYTTDVCACASESTNTEEWNACNEKRKEFFTKFGLAPDDVTANKANDEMYDCLTEYEK